LVIFWLFFVWSYIAQGCLRCFLSFEHAVFGLGLFCFFSIDFRDLNFFWRNVFSPALIGKNIGQTLTGYFSRFFGGRACTNIIEFFFSFFKFPFLIEFDLI